MDCVIQDLFLAAFYLGAGDGRLWLKVRRQEERIVLFFFLLLFCFDDAYLSIAVIHSM